MRRAVYPAYKPSGVAWLGDVPAHWEIKRLGYLSLKIGSGKTPSGGAETYQSDGVMLIRSQNVYEDGLRLNEVVYIDERVDEEMASTRVFSNDVLLNITGASLGRCSIVPKGMPSANVNQHVCIIRLDQKRVYPLFVKHVINSKLVQAQIFSFENGSSREGLNFQQVRGLTFSLPSLDEQKIIAGFLDRETAKLDDLIGKKRKLIEALQEKRSALISRTVTRGLPPAAAQAAGLDPHPPMKPSGIDWLGEVPAHWEIKAIARLTKLVQTGPFGSQLHESDYVDGGIPLINPAHIQDGTIFHDEQSAVDEETWERLDRHRLQEGDIIMGRRGEIGRCAVITQNEAGWLCGTGSMVVRLINCDPFYYSRLISSKGFAELLELNAVGTTMMNLNPAIVRRMTVPHPPLQEQIAINKFLRDETAKIDKMIATVEAAIEKLQEYRAALITAAVTGKIDVRDKS